MPDGRHPLEGVHSKPPSRYIALWLADAAHSLVLAWRMHCHGRGAEAYVSKHGLFWAHQKYRTKGTEVSSEACIMISAYPSTSLAYSAQLAGNGSGFIRGLTWIGDKLASNLVV